MDKHVGVRIGLSGLAAQSKLASQLIDSFK